MRYLGARGTTGTLGILFCFLACGGCEPATDPDEDRDAAIDGSTALDAGEAGSLDPECGPFLVEQTPLVGQPVRDPPLVCGDFCGPPSPQGGYGTLILRFRTLLTPLDAEHLLAYHDAVVDVSTPTSPVAVSPAPPLGAVHRSVEGTVVISAGGDGVTTVDFAEPAQPRSLAHLALGADVSRAWRDGDYLLVEIWDDEDALTRVVSVDVTDPSSPMEVSSLELPHARDEYQHRRAFAAPATGRFHVVVPHGTSAEAPTRIHAVDVNPSTGVLVQSSEFAELEVEVAGPDGIEARDGVLAVVGLQYAKAVVSTFDATDLSPIGSTEVLPGTDEYLGGVAIADGRAYVQITSRDENRLEVVDLLSNPPSLTGGRIDTGASEGARLLPRGARMLVSSVDYDTGAARVALWDVGGTPTELSGLDFPSEVGVVELPNLDMAVLQSYGERDVAVYTLVDFTGDQLQAVATVKSPGYSWGVTEHAGRVWLYAAGRLTSFDLQDPQAGPWWPLAYGTGSVAVDGERAARVRDHEWSTWPELDVVPLDRAAGPAGIATASLRSDDFRRLWSWQLFAAEGYAFAAVRGEIASNVNERSGSALVPVSLTDADAPPLGTWVSFPDLRGNEPGNEFVVGRADRAIVQQVNVSSETADTVTLQWADVTDPENITIHALDVSHADTSEGFLDGTVFVATGVEAPDEEHARFELIRIDFAGGAPQELARVDVSGSVLAYHADDERVLVRSQSVRSLDDVTRDACREQLGDSAYFEPRSGERGHCNALAYALEVLEVRGSTACRVSHTPIDAHIVVANRYGFVGRVFESIDDGTVSQIVLGAWDSQGLELRSIDTGGRNPGEPQIVDTRISVFMDGVHQVYDTRCLDEAPVTVENDLVIADDVTEGARLFEVDGPRLVPLAADPCAAP